MGYFSDDEINVLDQYYNGDSTEQIAAVTGLTIDKVCDIIQRDADGDYDCDDSDDGYALASAGWGTDEDYGG